MATVRTADFPFTIERAADGGDGFTFEGYVAVYDTPAAISDQFGNYTETVARTAFNRTLQRGMPPLLFQHGKHPIIGEMPLGVIREMDSRPRGLWVSARLSDNWLVEPVRVAIRDEAITGCSVRMELVKVDDVGRGKDRTRTIREAKLIDVGPVVSPAYKETTALVRSSLGVLAEREHITVTFAERDETISTKDPSVRELVSDALESLWGLNDENADAYIIDLYDDRAVFAVVGASGETSEYQGLWQVDYTYSDGNVNIGTPVNVEGVAPREQAAGDTRDTTEVHIYDEGAVVRAYSADDRKKMASSGEAMPDGSYPIANKADLQNAIHAVGRGSGDHNAIRRHIIKRAKALGAADMIPPDWNSDGSTTTSKSQDLSTSNELAERTSEELADTAPTGPVTREEMIRLIALQERGVHIPKEKADASH